MLHNEHHYFSVEEYNSFHLLSVHYPAEIKLAFMCDTLQKSHYPPPCWPLLKMSFSRSKPPANHWFWWPDTLIIAQAQVSEGSAVPVVSIHSFKSQTTYSFCCQVKSAFVQHCYKFSCRRTRPVREASTADSGKGSCSKLAARLWTQWQSLQEETVYASSL